jgi:hypothetical protein
LFSSSRSRLYLRQLSFCFCRGVVIAIVVVRSIVFFVLIVESYSSPTLLHHARSIIRSFRRHVHACVFVVVVLDNTSSWLLFTFVRGSKYVVLEWHRYYFLVWISIYIRQRK